MQSQHPISSQSVSVRISVRVRFVASIILDLYAAFNTTLSSRRLHYSEIFRRITSTMKSDSIPTLLLLASTCLPPSALAATIPRSTPPSYEPDSISWQSCGSGIPKTVECAYVSVPLDWSKPNGEKIKIAVNRLQATDKSSTDNLVINPGGPGGSGTSAVLEIATGAYGSAKLKKKYNLSKSIHHHLLDLTY